MDFRTYYAAVIILFFLTDGPRHVKEALAIIGRYINAQDPTAESDDTSGEGQGE